MPWTEFWDMHSGGGLKEPPFHYIYIEGTEDDARVSFIQRFRHNPENVTCACCGADYAVQEYVSLAQATGYQRGCRTLEARRDPETGHFQYDDGILRENGYVEEGQDPPDGYSVSAWQPWQPYQTLSQYIERPDVFILPAKKIRD